MPIIFAVAGTILVLLSLEVLVPEGNWLFLGGLVVGTQMLLMSIRSYIRR